MGVVYAVKDLQDGGRTLALKLSRAEMESIGDEQAVRRFQREVESLKKIQHPNIVKIYDEGSEDNKIFFTMELIDGWPLSALIEQQQLSLRQSIEIIAKIAQVVHFVHSHGIIHRDLKPDNIMITREEYEPVLMDFGIAKVLEAHTRLTREGATVGSSFYMSPEQAMGYDEITACSDVFALGIILYQMITGVLPFTGKNPSDVFFAIIDEVPKPVRSLNDKIPHQLEKVCMKALEKKRKKRYPTAEKLAEALAEVQVD